MKKILFLLLFPLCGTMAQNVTLIATGTSWKYLANGSNQGTAWRATAFNDASWPSGNAELGYGDGGEATVVPYGPSSFNKYITTYFRKSFTVTNPAAYTALSLQLLRDDGAVVYLNGTQVARSNMPTGTISYTTRASSTITSSGETTYYTYTPTLSLLVTGTNVIAVEVHQVNPSSPDLSFNLSLTATSAASCGTPGSLTATGITTTGATVNWGTVSGATSYNLRYRAVGSSTWINQTTTQLSFVLSSLTSATQYEFSVQAVCGSLTGSFSNNANFTTLSPPSCGTPGSLAATGITTTSATVNWSAVTGATSYNLQYRAVGNPSWINQNTTQTSFTLSSLVSATQYEFSVQAVCGSLTGSFSGNANFTTLSPPSCGIPGSLVSSNISATGATVSWSAVTGATGYNISFRVFGTTPWTTVTSTTNNKSLTSLSPGTKYEYMVQAACTSGTGNFSAISTFSTYINGTDSLITTNSSWKYLDNGSNQGPAWYGIAFSDASWLSGNAELGYGDGDEATTLSYGGNSSVKYITTYFRKTFNMTNPAVYAALNLSVVRDDGIVVYLNGIEVYRNNMPTGTILYSTLSPVAIGGVDESAWNSVALNPTSLLQGNNIIAVEIHQQAVTSTDISFKARLTGSGSAPLPVVTRGAYIQVLTPTSAKIRWRTDVACNSMVNFGTTISYGSSVSDVANTTEHIVSLTGLTPGTRYYYSIGTTTNSLQGSATNNFYTAPVTGSQTPVRIWAIGDFGNGSSQQAAVRNSFMTYTGSTPVNLWLWLGDNAYSTGTDAEYQTNVFNMYPDQMKSFPLYPSPGNHDYGNAGYQTTSTLTTNWPYFSIFSVPQSGEAGGVPSNTPKYYSYNYANIHFISLDSYGSYNTAGSAMYNWLSNDLAANTQRWTIVYFHHPPYTKGSHNSDTDQQLINMRTNIVPLLENYHIDLVLCGHSHMNERSYLIKGHYGIASSFTQAMKMSTGTTSFTKTPPYDGTIYAVCGTSGQSPGATQTSYPMPCMYFGNNTNNCSLVMDVNGDVLTCRYLASTGSILDQFTITKTGARVMNPVKPENVNVFFDTEEDQVVLDYFIESQTTTAVQWFAVTGQEVSINENPVQNLEPGFHRIYLEKPDVPTGVYILRVQVNEKSYPFKIVIP